MRPLNTTPVAAVVELLTIPLSLKSHANQALKSSTPTPDWTRARHSTMLTAMHELPITSHRQVNGLRYALRESGADDGRPIWLLHGLLDTGASFAGLIAALARCQGLDARFIAPDWRGHGASAPSAGSYWFPYYLADLEALIEQDPDPRPVVLIGHSMGGQAASLYAGLRPARVACLITLDSLNVPDTPPAAAPARYRQWLDAGQDPPRDSSYASIQALTQRIQRRYPELTPGQHRRLADEWSETGDDGRCRLRVDPKHRVVTPYGFRAAEAMAIWGEVTAPVLCIDGGASPARGLLSEVELAERHACFARLTRVVLDAAGHMLHVQQTARVAQEIACFLDAAASDAAVDA